jgi:dephospho-CoA kinase
MVGEHISARIVRRNINVTMLVCVTGKMGSGKTTAINALKSWGFNTFVMDDYIHHIYLPYKIGYYKIINTFGKRYINPYGVNRAELKKLVFNSPTALGKLNKIMIPIMQKKLADLKKHKKLTFVELAVYLNHPRSFQKYFDKIVLISPHPQIEKKNLIKFFNGVKILPTNAVGKHKNPIKNTVIRYDFLVENSGNKKQFLTKLKEISKYF